MDLAKRYMETLGLAYAYRCLKMASVLYRLLLRNDNIIQTYMHGMICSEIPSIFKYHSTFIAVCISMITFHFVEKECLVN